MTFSSERFGRAMTFIQSPGAGREAGVEAEITGEKRGVAEIVVPGKLLERLVCAKSSCLSLEDDDAGTISGNREI